MKPGATPPTRPTAPPAARAPGRTWLFRLLAVVAIPAVLLVTLEGTLRLSGYGRPTQFLIPDEQPGQYRTNPDFGRLFFPAGFDLRPVNQRVAKSKPPGTVRIVVLGESAAMGVPEPMFGVAPHLRAQLRARFPGREVEVVNAGIVAINSHVIRRITADLRDFDVDLFVIYAGNNEVVGPYAPGCTYLPSTPPLWAIRASVAVRATRTGQLATALLGRLGRRSADATWGGMAMFAETAVAGDDPRLEEVYANFEANLADIVATARAGGAQVLLSTVVANLADCAPLLSRHRPDLSPVDRDAWQRAYESGRLAWLLGDHVAARGALQEARRLDPQHAESAFLLGRVELESGNVAAARPHLVDALHWDALRFRPDAQINEVIRRVARSRQVPLVDAAVELGGDDGSAAPPAGRELLFEHVHFNWRGNFRLARLLAEAAAPNLPGGRPDDGGWLDDDGAAAALGFTAHERLPLLLRMEALVRKPPFTNQVTYAEEMARFARDLEAAQAAFHDPASLVRAAEVVRAALTADPSNPELLAIARGVSIDRGDLASALAELKLEQRLRPAEFGLFAGEASLLARLGRTEEAEGVLRRAEALERDPSGITAAWADFFIRSGRLADGRRHLDVLVARHPGRPKLRLIRANLARLAGDLTAAEREYRDLLAQMPVNEDALEALVRLLRETRRDADANAASLAAADAQPANHANNLRVALLREARGDEAAAARFLEAATRSGPVNAGVAVRLAGMLHVQGRSLEALLYLARARRLAIIEGDTATVAELAPLIARLRAEAR